MKQINDYFLIAEHREKIPHWISLCGKLEAIIGSYFLAGAGVPDNNIQILYHDSTVGFDEDISLEKKNIIAYFLEDENVMFVREDMIEKLKRDTAEYGIAFISVSSFETDELYMNLQMEVPALLKNIIWIDDDFMNDDSKEFDFEAFEIIDSGRKYINPKHFSVMDLIRALQKTQEF